MEPTVDHYRPATDEDVRNLQENRATVWPGVLATIVVVAAVAAALGLAIGWVRMLVVALVVALVVVVALLAYGLTHLMGPEDVRRCAEELPGCDIFPAQDVRITAGKKYHYDCAPSDLYPYVVQMNLTKAGFYSFDFLERLFGFHIRNDYTIRPEWQRLRRGDWMYYHQNGAGTGVVDFKENEYITTYSDTRYKPTEELAVAWRPKWMSGFAWTWNFYFEPDEDGEGTRFSSSLQAWWPEDTGALTVARLMVEWGVPSIVMMNKMASKMGHLAEADARARRAGQPRPGYRGRR